jgi:FkbH-like protein
LQALIEQQGGIVLWMRLLDRFGDNGLIGIAIGIPTSREQWRIDALLMSCRVLGRQAETVLLGVLAQWISERGGKTLVGEYIPTSKNGQVVDFYKSYGFQALDDSGQQWSFDLAKARIALPDFMHIQYEAGQECYG